MKPAHTPTIETMNTLCKKNLLETIFVTTRFEFLEPMVYCIKSTGLDNDMCILIIVPA